MSDTLEPVMQAAERLRRCATCSSIREVYPHGTAPWVQVGIDRETLSDFALSILPKGKRPVPLGSVTDGSWVWFAENGRCLHVPVRLREHTGEYLVEIDGSWVNAGACNLFASKEDAELELEWEQFEAIHGR